MLTYTLEPCGGAPLYEQLSLCIRGDIRRGELAPGSRLPSKRALAEHLGISVVTVEGAYALLEEEGYIFSRPRSGFFVCAEELPPSVCAPAPVIAQSAVSTDAGVELSIVYFAKLMRRVVMRRGGELLVKTPHNGCAELRRAIAEHLYRYRGMRTTPENLIVGSGAEYLYSMLVQLLGRERVFGLETPSYEKIRRVYTAMGARCEMLPMDENGIRPAALNASSADVLHITPYHSYPTGVTAPASRRMQYLRWARARDAVIVEDDFDSEFAVGMRPVETLYAMDESGCVIYMNTFSKTIAPSLRVGYMVLPDRLMQAYREKLGFYSCTVPALDQYLLTEFIQSGGFERHLNRMRHKLRAKTK